MTPVKLDTDVLVLGGGSGGLCAAMAAREAGARVTLVYKTGGNATAVAAGGYAVVLPDAADDSADHLMADALRSGAGLVDQTLPAPAGRAVLPRHPAGDRLGRGVLPERGRQLPPLPLRRPHGAPVPAVRLRTGAATPTASSSAGRGSRA